MNDRPTAVELLAAARQFLEAELIPTLSDARLKFQTLITANVLAIVERELSTSEGQLLEEWNWITDVLAFPMPVPNRLQGLNASVRKANEVLCKRIRRGDFDGPARFAGLSSQLRRVVEHKLEVGNPRYLASLRSSASNASGEENRAPAN